MSSEFIQRNVDSEIASHHNIYRRITSSQIYTYQKHFYELNGWCNKKFSKKDRRTKYFYSKRKYRCFNCKGSEWAKKGIYIVPGIKILKRDHALKDRSGINPIDKDALYVRILENIFGTLFENSINYAKSEQHLKINLHADVGDDPIYYMPAKHFLRIISAYEKSALAREDTLRAISRLVTNSMYGSFPMLTNLSYDFISDCVPIVIKAHYRFQVINASGEIVEEYNTEISTNSTDTLCDLIKQCLETSKVDKDNLTLDITFITPKN